MKLPAKGTRMLRWYYRPGEYCSLGSGPHDNVILHIRPRRTNRVDLKHYYLHLGEITMKDSANHRVDQILQEHRP